MRVLFVSRSCYLDDSHGAAVASRAMMGALARHGVETAVLSGSALGSAGGADLVSWLAQRGWPDQDRGPVAYPFAGTKGAGAEAEIRCLVDNVRVTILVGPPQDDPIVARHEGARLLRRLVDELRLSPPDVVVGHGTGPFIKRAFRTAQDHGAVTVFAIHSFACLDASLFENVDAAICPSRFAAEYYRRELGVHCTVLPNLIDMRRVLVDRHERRYVTFVNPSKEKGVYVFARIAEVLGKSRPDVPFLVVEGRGDERTLARCGLDLRPQGNVFLMRNTADPRRFWRLTRVCLMPSLWWENQPLVAIEAMINGVPVIGSDRGGLPETLGHSGTVLALPERLTPVTEELPTPEEIAPWVDAIVRCWDERHAYDELARRARLEAGRWAPDVLEPQYLRFFHSLANARTARHSP